MKYHKDGTLPTNGEVFVFGSNLAGRHGAGAAAVAYEQLGALWARGEGRFGQSYAIPTKSYRIETLPLDRIASSVRVFLEHAASSRYEEFFVTAIGCGLAGYEAKDIAPMFKDAPENCSFPDVWEKYL